MSFVSKMKDRIAKQQRANANKGNKMRKTRRNNVNRNMRNARNSGKFGSDLTNARFSTRGGPKTFKLPPRPKSPPPPPPKKKPRVCNTAYAKNLAARGSPLPECRVKGAGKRRRRRKPKRRPTKKRHSTRRRG